MSRTIVKKGNTAQGKIHIDYVDIDALNPYENNPRDNDDAVEFVKNSIADHGFLVPLVVSTSNVIITGHTRHKAAKALGLTELPVIYANELDEKGVKNFRLQDNKTSEAAKWNRDLLGIEHAFLQEMGIDSTRYGWTQNEIDCLTDVVQEDCLSAGSVVEEVESGATEGNGQRAPNTARVVIGEFVFFIPQEVYRRWANEIRVEGDYDEAIIYRALKDKLGITEYEEAHRRGD